MGLLFRLFAKKTSEELIRECQRGRKDNVLFLLESLDARKCSGALRAAAAAGHAEIVQVLLERSALPDAKSYETTAMGSVGDFSTYESTALTDAIKGRHYGVVQVLLKHGANPNKVRSVGTQAPSFSPIYDAARVGDVHIVKLLLEAGADVDGCGDSSPLHAAAWKGHLDVAKVLLEAGASIHRRLKGDWTAHPQPIHTAVENGHLAVAEFLLENGADVNASGSGVNGDKTPLEYVISRMDMDRRYPSISKGSYPGMEMKTLLKKYGALQ
ncbi:MAG: ankyrin repeat domain-containing protein [Candidatus Omnitrophica bacterium]|nr:ankyrin repeat domain-containing protein [Candidatus Omnitrophota bacterium]